MIGVYIGLYRSVNGCARAAAAVERFGVRSSQNAALLVSQLQGVRQYHMILMVVFDYTTADAELQTAAR